VGVGEKSRGRLSSSSTARDYKASYRHELELRLELLPKRFFDEESENLDQQDPKLVHDTTVQGG
jgi:hypothetical protein